MPFLLASQVLGYVWDDMVLPTLPKSREMRSLLRDTSITIDPIRSIHNDIPNLNVTHASLNNLKGCAVTAFCKDWFEQDGRGGDGLRVGLEKYIDSRATRRKIASAVDKSFRVIEEGLDQVVQEYDYPFHRTFLEELTDMTEKMKIHDV